MCKWILNLDIITYSPVQNQTRLQSNLIDTYYTQNRTHTLCHISAYTPILSQSLHHAFLDCCYLDWRCGCRAHNDRRRRWSQCCAGLYASRGHRSCSRRQGRLSIPATGKTTVMIYQPGRASLTCPRTTASSRRPLIHPASRPIAKTFSTRASCAPPTWATRRPRLLKSPLPIQIRPSGITAVKALTVPVAWSDRSMRSSTFSLENIPD